jgi:hypothetical protein
MREWFAADGEEFMHLPRSRRSAPGRTTERAGAGPT